MLAQVHRDSPMLAALYLETFSSKNAQQLLSRISELKKLVFRKSKIAYLKTGSYYFMMMNSFFKIYKRKINLYVKSYMKLPFQLYIPTFILAKKGKNYFCFKMVRKNLNSQLRTLENLIPNPASGKNLLQPPLKNIFMISCKEARRLIWPAGEF